MVRPAVYRPDPADLVLRSRRQDFRSSNIAKTLLSSLFFLAGALRCKLTFRVTIEKSNQRPRPPCCSFCRRRLSWRGVCAGAEKAAGSVCAFQRSRPHWWGHLLVTHGDPTSLSISPAALFSALPRPLPRRFTRRIRQPRSPVTAPCRLSAEYVDRRLNADAVLYAGRGTAFVIDGSLLLAFFYLVVIGTALTFSLYLKGAQMIGGPKASILSCAEPLSSALSVIYLRAFYPAGLAGHAADCVVGGVDFDGFEKTGESPGVIYE